MRIYVKDYQYLDCFKGKDLLEFKDIIDILLEQETKIRVLEDELEKLENDVRDNMIRIKVSEQVGISDRDFI